MTETLKMQTIKGPSSGRNPFSTNSGYEYNTLKWPNKSKLLSVNMVHRKTTGPLLKRSLTLSVCSSFLFLCIILHELHPNYCFQDVRNVRNYNKRNAHPQGQDLSSDSLETNKRTLIQANAAEGSMSQPEEIFTANDQMEYNYDEYPMVVPKRAALLLDRLMVALHHALEKERNSNSRLSDFYGKNSNGKISIPGESRNKETSGESSDLHEKDSPYLTMYSDDDPSVLMDYDFKDLNSINRATGETLMGQSFQRRANMGINLGGDVGREGVSSLLSASTSSAHGGDLISGVNSGDLASSGRANFGTNGRMYWRCYFNAVSCF